MLNNKAIRGSPLEFIKGDLLHFLHETYYHYFKE